MKKYAVPMTVVPGATKDIDKETLTQNRDKKGRPLWNMPKPVGTHETTQVVKKIVTVDGKPKLVRVKEKVSFPVYRGVSASLWRYLKAQARYQHKLALRKRAKDMLAKENEDAMQEEILTGGAT